MVGKVRLFNDPNTQRRPPFFNGRRTLTNPSSANFTIGRFDKKGGGFPSMTIVHIIAKTKVDSKVILS